MNALHTLPDVVILRGISGSGKSTRAQALAALTPTVIVSADNYFTTPDGKYLFDPAKLPAAHADCLNRFLVALRMNNHRIVVDNTNTTAVEIAPYYALAEAHLRSVEIFTIRAQPGVAHLQNIHGVPVEGIMRQHERLVAEQLPARWKHRIIEAE